MIRLGFYGAAGEVTGSCYVVATDRARVMVDMGMHQGEKEADKHNRRLPAVELKSLSAVVLTHAHLDHCGRLPMLIRGGYRGRIHCTEPTAQLTGIILQDSAALQEADCERFNRRLKRNEEPCDAALYTPQDVERTLPQLATLPYNERKEIAPGIEIEMFDAGHILGAASVRMTVRDDGREVNIVFSGDVGVIGSPILRDPVTPTGADVVLLESTYGDRDHRSLADTRAELLTILKEITLTRAKALVPAFALGRTQDILYNIGEFERSGGLAPLKVCVDSPMATKISRLYAGHTEVYDEPALALLAKHLKPLNFPGLTYTQTVEESKRLNDAQGPLVIVAASGMCTGGRILHHLVRNLPDPRTHVIIVGFQGYATLGRRLVEGATRVRIFREDVDVRAKVHTLGGFSAHAGQTELLAWATPFQRERPRMFLTHGEDGPRAALRDKLKSRLGLDALLPKYGNVVAL